MKYRVVPGDNLSSLGQRFNVPYQQITGYKSGNPDLIMPGEELDIPDPVTPQQQQVSQLNQEMTPIIQQAQATPSAQIAQPFEATLSSQIQQPITAPLPETVKLNEEMAPIIQ